MRCFGIICDAMGSHFVRRSYFQSTNPIHAAVTKRRMGKSGKNRIPDRWEMYTKFGKQVLGTRFVPFKVPLRAEMAMKVPDEERFMPKDLIDHFKRENLNVKMVIDLTNTNRYYDPSLLEKHNIHYVKLCCNAYDQAPEEKTVQEFVELVEKFRLNCPNEDHLIGVHCTHGLNRTGYMICRYIMHSFEVSAQEAIDRFNSARGHPMEKYTESLLQFNMNSQQTTTNYAARLDAFPKRKMND